MPTRWSGSRNRAEPTCPLRVTTRDELQANGNPLSYVEGPARLMRYIQRRRCCVGKPKSLKDKLWGAAVVKMSFMMSGGEESPKFKSIYAGVLRDLGLEDEQVDKYIEENRAAVEKAARGSSGGSSGG